MALIGEIRERSWLLMLVIGLAMVGFIFMDSFSGPRSIFGGGQTTLGEVEGEEIDQRKFEQAYSALYSGGSGDVFQQRASLWNYMVEDKLVRQEAREIGLAVPREELEDLTYGTNLSPIITSRFRDQQTGQVNRENLNSYRDAENNGTINDPTVVDPSRKNFWYFQKTEINKQRLQDKLAALVSKSMYTPDWMAEELAKGQNTRVDLAFVKVPYTEIDDASVSLTDADYAKLIAADGAKYRRAEPGRAITYVSFDVEPTVQDSADIRERLNTLKTEWAAAPDDSVFVVQNRGVYPTTYLEDEQLPDAVRGAEVGAIVGPYLNVDRYAITKVIDRKAIPDSVRSRHILLPTTTQEEANRSFALADSLVTLIEDGTNTFDELARQFSTGPTSTKGGDLGYVTAGTMVGPFNDLIFYQAEEGELNQVITQFGLHVVEVTGKKFINDKVGTRIATLDDKIEPSDDTQKARYEVASRFAQTNRTVDALRSAAEADPSIELVEGTVVGPNDYVVGALGSNNSSRDLVKFAFKEDVGTVSPNVYSFKAPNAFYDGRYVVGAVTSEVPAGMPTAASAKMALRQPALQMKKAELVAQAGNMSAIASKYGVELDTARAVNFGSAFVPNLGAEPKAIAQAFSLPVNTESSVIAGQGGVIVVKPLVRTEPGDVSTSVANVQRSQNAQINGNVRNRFGAALRESAEIEDNRARFY